MVNEIQRLGMRDSVQFDLLDLEHVQDREEIRQRALRDATKATEAIRPMLRRMMSKTMAQPNKKRAQSTPA